MSSFIPLLAIIIAFVCLTPAVCFFFYRPRRNAPFPPGPKGLPLAGNLLDMPSEKEWLTFAKWGEIYGITSTMIRMTLNALTRPFLRRHFIDLHP